MFWAEEESKHELTLEMKGMWILVYGLMSLIRTWVLMFRSSSETQPDTISYLQNKTRFLWNRKSLLTLYVLSDERVVHDVAVIRF